MATIETTPTRTYKLTFFRIFRSEWIKLFTLRSTWWILALTVVANIGISIALASILKWVESEAAAHAGVGTRPGGAPVTIGPGDLGTLSGLVVQSCGFVGQLVFIILSILVITNEYSSGMIRSTLTVAPRRGRVLVAKLLVIAILCVLVFSVSMAIGWWGGYQIAHGMVGLDVVLTSTTSMRVLGGFIAEMVLIAWMCFGLGAWIRSTAASIGVAVGLLLVLPMIITIFTNTFANAGTLSGWRKWLVDGSAYLPTNAGNAVTADPVSDTAILQPWQGLVVLAVWTVVVLIIAGIITKRRDV
ncbi:MAG: ABC transporter permease [Propionibacteriaceae bacterium]|nr:ABC transporter permease [Propionibacteriaceae bacterium]